MSERHREHTQMPRRSSSRAAPSPDDDTDRLLTIDDFCRSERISRRFYHCLAKRGEGPEIIRLGNGRGIIRISREARQRWRERMSAEVRPGA